VGIESVQAARGGKAFEEENWEELLEEVVTVERMGVRPHGQVLIFSGENGHGAAGGGDAFEGFGFGRGWHSR
jgi:hypothetical protein